MALLGMSRAGQAGAADGVNSSAGDCERAVMTINTVHEELIRANLDAPMTEDDALLWMALLHTHEIHFRSPLLSDRPNWGPWAG
jgi:hypothetical protein